MSKKVTELNTILLGLNETSVGFKSPLSLCHT